MVIYDTEVQTKEFEPEAGVPAKDTLYMCLDRKRFWPVVPLVSPEEEARRRAEEEAMAAAPPPPKKRLSALERIQAKYGEQSEEESEGLHGGVQGNLSRLAFRA